MVTYGILCSRLQSLAAQQANAPLDIDFGENDVNGSPLLPPTVLTPPKISTHKRSFPTVRPDTQIELSDALWKRQRMELTLSVVKRPPLPIIEMENQMGPEMIPRVETLLCNEIGVSREYRGDVATEGSNGPQASRRERNG